MQTSTRTSAQLLFVCPQTSFSEFAVVLSSTSLSTPMASYVFIFPAVLGIELRALHMLCSSYP